MKLITFLTLLTLSATSFAADKIVHCTLSEPGKVTEALQKIGDGDRMTIYGQNYAASLDAYEAHAAIVVKLVDIKNNRMVLETTVKGNFQEEINFLVKAYPERAETSLTCSSESH
ncbi:MAG: hypothetical protein ACJ76H_02525 [Bacteriovoracaceae bacterium]